MVACTLIHFVIPQSVGYMVASAFINFVISNGIGDMPCCSLIYFFSLDRVRNMIACTFADFSPIKRSIAMILARFAGAEAQQGEKYVKEFLHYLMYHCRDVNVMIKGMTGRNAVLHIVDNFTVFNVREHLPFLFLRERQSIPAIVETF